MEKSNIKYLDLLNTLNNISSIIASKYSKLLKLEIDDNKKEEYNKIIKSLKYYIDKENNLYSKISNDDKKSLLDYIMFYKTPSFFVDNKESIFIQDYQYMLIRRIIDKLINDDTYEFKLSLNGELVDAKDDFLKILRTSNHIKLEIENDIYGIYLTILNDLIKKDKKKLYINNFIGSKYYLSFINKEMERRLIRNRFKVDDNIVLNSKDLALKYDFDIDFYKEIKDNYLYDECVNYITKLLLISDDDYSNQVVSINALLIRSYVKSLMFLLSDLLINNINYDFHNYIESKDYLKKHFNNSISEQLSISIFKEIKKDRNIHKLKKLK